MRPDGQLLRELTAAQDLDPIGGTVDQARCPQKRVIDPAICIEAFEVTKVHRQIAYLVAAISETTLRNSPDQRHLSAFETNPDRTA